MKKSHEQLLLGVLLLVAAPIGLCVHMRLASRTPLPPPNWMLAVFVSSLVFGAGHLLIAAGTETRALRGWSATCAVLTVLVYLFWTSGACLGELLFSMLAVLTLIVTLLVAKEVAKEVCHGFALPPGLCVSCGYDLRGLPEQRCPECGQPFDPASLAARSAFERGRFPCHRDCAIGANLILAFAGLALCLPGDIPPTERIEKALMGATVIAAAVVNAIAVRRPEYVRNRCFRVGLIASWVLCAALGVYFGSLTAVVYGTAINWEALTFFVPIAFSASLVARRRRRPPLPSETETGVQDDPSRSGEGKDGVR